VTSASRRLVLLQVGAAPAQQGIKTNPKCQRERTAVRAGGGSVPVPGVVRLRRSLGGSGPRLRDSGGGFAARERTAGHCSSFYDGPAVADDPLARRRPFELGSARPDPIRHSLKRKIGDVGQQAARASMRLVLLQVGAAPAQQGIKTNPKCQRERTAVRAGGGSVPVPGVVRLRRSLGGSGPRLRDSGGGFAARERTAGSAALFTTAQWLRAAP
jgi:hypothetical protein